jgi:hypothetical protein
MTQVVHLVKTPSNKTVRFFQMDLTGYHRPQRNKFRRGTYRSAGN